LQQNQVAQEVEHIYEDADRQQVSNIPAQTHVLLLLVVTTAAR